MSGERGGAASEVPAVPRNNMQVSITHLFRITTPVGRRRSRRRLFDGGRTRRKILLKFLGSGQ